MKYTITSTEKTKMKASDSETKAMLHLMNHYDEVYWFVIDFFNDVTGINSLGLSAWDIQSKSKKKLYGKEIGRDLVTLFKNYNSKLKFEKYIVFLGGVADSVRVDKNVNIFDLSNIADKTFKSIKEGLEEESEKKLYINNDDITDEKIIAFLEKVIFVIDYGNKADYIKKCVSENAQIKLSDEFFEKIFNEIRNMQSSLKNIETEGIEIDELSDFERYKKHLKSENIKLLIISRCFHINTTSLQVPIGFTSFINNRDEEDIQDILEECKNNINRILFDKNNKDLSWDLLTDIYNLLEEYTSIDDVFDRLDKNKLTKIQFLDFITTKYLISLIKEGKK